MSSFDGVLRESRVGCWAWVNDRVEWDETTRLLFDQKKIRLTTKLIWSASTPKTVKRWPQTSSGSSRTLTMKISSTGSSVPTASADGSLHEVLQF